MALIPPWTYGTIGQHPIAPSLVISGAVVIGRIGRVNQESKKAHVADYAVLGVVVIGVAAMLVTHTPKDFVVMLAAEVALCYAAGRLLYLSIDPSRLAQIMTWVGVVLSPLAIAQSLNGFNVSQYFPFNYIVGSQQWIPLQLRGSHTRAELTFGHSIALGGTLALTLAFASRVQSLPMRILAVGIILAGTFSTFSRGAMLACMIVLVLSVLTSRMIPVRKATMAIGIGIVIASISFLFTDQIGANAASASSAAASGQARLGLFQLVSDVRIFGFTHGVLQQTGSFDISGFTSIDNSLIYIGLYVGAIGALLYAIPYLFVVVRAIRFGWRPADIAVAAQLPLILTVAPITQYKSFYWLAVGFAVTRSLQDQRVHKRRRMMDNHIDMNDVLPETTDRIQTDITLPRELIRTT
jgi:hypothetical protein